MPSDGRLFWIRSNWLIHRLQNNIPTTAAHLAEKYCYSVQSARRTIQSLRDDFGAPLHFDHEKNTWQLSDPSWSMPDLPLSPEEVSAVALAKSLISKISAPNIVDPMERFWRKLCMNLSQQSPAGAGFAHAVSARAPAWSQVPHETMEICLRALALNTRLHITYLSPWNSTISERTIEPRHLLLYDGAYYLIAHCLLKSGDLRFFNLRAIKTIELTETPCSKTEFKIEDAIDSYGLMLGGEKTTVTLRIHPPRGARAAIENWHPEQQDTLEPDGTLIRSFPVRGMKEVHRLVLSYGASVEVIEPDKLREGIKKEILATADKYKTREPKKQKPEKQKPEKSKTKKSGAEKNKTEKNKDKNKKKTKKSKTNPQKTTKPQKKVKKSQKNNKRQKK